MRKHHPYGCCGNPRICLIHVQGQKSLKGLPRATHCTNRAQTSGKVTPTVELCPPPLTIRIKVRARRYVPEEAKMTIIRIHIHIRYLLITASRFWVNLGFLILHGQYRSTNAGDRHSSLDRLFTPQGIARSNINTTAVSCEG